MILADLPAPLQLTSGLYHQSYGPAERETGLSTHFYLC